jgi:urea transport system permease protein
MPGTPRLILALMFVALAGVLHAAEPVPKPLQETVTAWIDAEGDARAKLVKKISDEGDGRLVPLLNAYSVGMLEKRDGVLAIYQFKVEVPGKPDKLYPLVDAFTLQPLKGPDGSPLYADSLGKAMLKAPRAERRDLTELVSTLSLLDPDPVKRMQAIVEAGDRGDATPLAALKAHLAKDPRGKFADNLKVTIAQIETLHTEGPARVAAIQFLGASGNSRGSSTLTKALTAADDAKDAALRTVIVAANDRIESYQSTVRFVHHTFAGLSLGSILILMALGLSIIFGLMGVINMAHGEFMMVGAFTAFVVCEFFKNHLPPSMFDYYFIVALPAAFLVAGTVGYLCEALIIRHLYGRPLETLLATWGISLILIQTARVLFGDTNSLTPPSWMSGGLELGTDLILPLNRLFIILFCGGCVALVYLIINKTKLGLLLRATTQNRTMANCLGVKTRRVDGLTFGLGAGLAGLAGVTVPLFDKINPQMGQGYIVDSFMVVVLGGVGKLAGSIIAGLGLGFLGKYIEPMIAGTGSVIYGKIIVLALIITVLQWRPSGLFPAKGRLADA